MAQPQPELSLAGLRIVKYPDPALRRRAAPVKEVTPDVRDVALRMIELMREAEGIGLAAPQVGLPWRLFVTHVPPAEDRSPESNPVTATASPRIYINPVLSSPVGPPDPFDEGCLSLPDITGEVLRPPVITITALDLEGREFSQTGAGLLARCWQHELDHLDGVLIIDRMTQMSRLKNRSALRDLEKRRSKS
jgi:peptide deformylase